MNRTGEECGEDIIFQGAIDLLAIGDDGVEIIDYKYSRKNAAHLLESYALQLRLYRKAVARILRIDEEKIACTIINILYGFEVAVD